MAAGTIGGFLTVILVLLGVGGLVGGLYVYLIHPWERVNRESRIPATPRTVALTRLGTTVCLLTFPVVAAGALAQFWGTMAALGEEAGAGGSRTVLEQAAVAFPGELVALAGILVGAVAAIVPIAFVLVDAVTGLLGWREV